MPESYSGAFRYTTLLSEQDWYEEYLEQEKLRLKELVGVHIVKVLLKDKTVRPIVAEKTINYGDLGRYKEYQIRVDFVPVEA